MTFVTGYDRESGRFTLTSQGVTGRPNVEEFDDVNALDFKVRELEYNGHDVMISPALIVEERLYKMLGEAVISALA